MSRSEERVRFSAGHGLARIGSRSEPVQELEGGQTKLKDEPYHHWTGLRGEMG
jgi:hypothetical protein